MDQTGAAANVKRHDYLPFGEELFAGAGGRTAAMGYAAGDGVRPQFTQKERDIETGLDYFNARYYSSIQGRFTGVDSGPFAVADPQNFNRDYKTLNQADAKLGSTLLGHCSTNTNKQPPLSKDLPERISLTKAMQVLLLLRARYSRITQR